MITLNELYEMMAVMIEIGEGKDHKVFNLIIVFKCYIYTNDSVCNSGIPAVRIHWFPLHLVHLAMTTLNFGFRYVYYFLETQL